MSLLNFIRNRFIKNKLALNWLFYFICCKNCTRSRNWGRYLFFLKIETLYVEQKLVAFVFLKEHFPQCFFQRFALSTCNYLKGPHSPPPPQSLQKPSITYCIIIEKGSEIQRYKTSLQLWCYYAVTCEMI